MAIDQRRARAEVDTCHTKNTTPRPQITHFNSIFYMRLNDCLCQVHHVMERQKVTDIVL